MNHRIYADHAATTYLSPYALEAMRPYLTDCFGNPSSIHSFGSEAAEAVSSSRYAIAEILNCEPEFIIFTSGGSEADNHAMKIMRAFAENTGKHTLLLSGIEHHAVLNSAYALFNGEFSISCIDARSDGAVWATDVAKAAENVRGDICGGSFMLANNETGSILDICSICSEIKIRGGLVHTDAVQAAGHIPVDFANLGVDMMSISAHKFHGPKGVGALICKSELSAEPLIFGGAQEMRRRAGTENVAGIVGMAAALSESADRMKRDSAHVSKLRDLLCKGLLSIPGSHVNGGGLPGVLSVRFDGGDGEALVRSLDLLGIAASPGAACNSKEVGASHVLISMGLTDKEAASTVRFSLDASNTETEILRIISAVNELLRY